MAVVFLVCYAMVESKPRYPYADQYPVVNDDPHMSDQTHVRPLLQQICLYTCEMGNKQTGKRFNCEYGCGFKTFKK